MSLCGPLTSSSLRGCHLPTLTLSPPLSSLAFCKEWHSCKKNETAKNRRYHHQQMDINHWSMYVAACRDRYQIEFLSNIWWSSIRHSKRRRNRRRGPVRASAWIPIPPPLWLICIFLTSSMVLMRWRSINYALLLCYQFLISSPLRFLIFLSSLAYQGKFMTPKVLKPLVSYDSPYLKLEYWIQNTNQTSNPSLHWTVLLYRGERPLTIDFKECW